MCHEGRDDAVESGIFVAGVLVPLVAVSTIIFGGGEEVDEVFDSFGHNVGTEGEAQCAQRGGAVGDCQVGFHGCFPVILSGSENNR